MKRSTKIILTVAGFIVVGFYLVSGTVYRDVGLHCDYTGSYQRWTSWPFWIRTNYSYEKSPIEEFVSGNFPDRLEHKWVSYEGTGKNIFGDPVFFGHGSPNALLMFPRSHLELFVEQSSRGEVEELYETLRRGDRDEIRDRVDKLYEESERLLQKLAEQDVDPNA